MLIVKIFVKILLRIEWLFIDFTKYFMRIKNHKLTNKQQYMYVTEWRTFNCLGLEVVGLNKLFIVLRRGEFYEYVKIEDSPHYMLVAGIIENDFSKIDVYKRYLMQTNNQKLYESKIEKVKIMISNYLTERNFKVLVTYHKLIPYRDRNYSVIDGAHRVAVLRYHEEECVESCVYYLGI